MPETIALVSCVKQKQQRPAPARNLYTSPLFDKMRAYAKRSADRWFILSAKYGLLHPDTIIEPYEQTLKTAGAVAKQQWAIRVHGQMAEAGLLQPGVVFLWLAGRDYQCDLARLLTRYEQRDPMAGMRFGPRLKWLNQQLHI